MFVRNLNGVVALLQLLSVSGALAHPGGMPRLMGRSGFVELRDLPDILVKRVVSPDATCGGTNGYTCGTTTNKCCSQHGWCGDSADYCSPTNGCQPAFGTCTGAGTTTTTTATATTATTPASTPTSVSTDGTCGTNGGHVCPTGQCCSLSGFCGTTEDYCMSPGCQIGFGNGCDADQTPSGTNTSTIARPKIGSVAYGGAGIYDCVEPGEIALTYDDGPYIYTDGMLDVLTSFNNAKATFFITGNNNGKGPIDTTPAWNAVIKKMYAAGHQLASHTWSHADLSTLTEAGRRDEMIKLEMAMRNIVGFFPTYMRPPYSSCSAACEATLSDLGYHVTYFDVDTDDYDNDSPLLIQNAKNNFLAKIGPSVATTDNFLVIGHDIHQQTAQNLTAYMLTTLLAKGYTPVTVGKCLGDPETNWYRSAAGAVSTTTATPTTVASSTASATTTAASSTCPFKVSTWCATPLPTYSTTATCWDSVTNCYAQGSACWSAVDSSPCGDYQTMCHAQEDVCQACANAGTTTCAYSAPVYPAS